MTDKDRDNYNKLPNDKWFKEMDIWLVVKRTCYSLKRLKEAGLVESKSNGGTIVYRKIKKK